jgi:hypothetical protein
MSSPENISSIGSQAPVERILGLSCGEGRVLGNHNEKNDGCSKKINGSTLVGLSQVNFRSHIILGSQLRLQIASSIFTNYWCSKAKVCNFQVEALVQKYVFRLEVSVSDTILVAIFKTF